ncbi:glycine betaine/L-proline ABC transporter ATP-binding protein [Methanoculleus sp. FWC-SCC1]|uniref:Glycine betaine/L-proline ABC transporter ATP-binding protein n=1 Tax=Methanoculleus frigidifontis TaxID=2584085 RepID=A0ABT8M6A4_9EURY|nr:glycine betaine/L-proline ABC transporter ATP-binding protein [Methanoculleus sp. FWC-SCC1]MDN7023473.1 glycine betaine/L-proline ABC transporter ATP-binding protein [Methanoculleus sp. FWC-SCC1]
MENLTEERPTVQVENLVKIFGPKSEKALQLLQSGCSKQDIKEKTDHILALKDVSFSVYPGEIFVLMGLSGCGKSTLLRCLNRLIEPTAGMVLIEGSNIVAMSPEELRETRRRKIGMIFQNFALLPHRSILENVGFGLEVQGMPEEERHKKAREALALVGLAGYEESMPDQLSGGMKQRVGLARALASDPDILLMDEAFSALDPLIRRDMQDELIELQERLSKTIIFVTHDLDEALKLGDRIALMKDGEIVQIGTSEDILTNPSNAYVEKFVADVDMAKVLTASDVMKRPEPVAPSTAGPRVALHLMEEHDIASIFVVNRQRQIRGLALIDDVVDALKTGKMLEDVLITDVPTVTCDTPVAEIIPVIADSKYPIGVVDVFGKIRGIIVRGSVLAALARKEIEGGWSAAPEASVQQTVLTEKEVDADADAA